MEKKYPFYLKGTTVLFGLILFVYILATLKSILVPLAFALMISILLNPLVNRFQRFKMHRAIAILLTLLIALLTVTGVFYFLSSQISNFADNVPLLEKKFGEFILNFQHWLSGNFSLTVQKQNQLLNEAGGSLKPLIGQTVGTVFGTLSILVLLPIYIFLILFYKTLILNFLYEVFAEQNSKEVATVLTQTKGAIQSYMVGLLLEAIVVACMNSTALLILGVDYAILLGVIGAILNILPYIGGLIAIALPLIIATMTKDGYTTQLGILVAYLVIQFIDNNILVPRIVSSKVKINALVSIVVVLLGGSLWGVSGMFLSIPFIAVLKIVFDRVPDLRPWGKLLGDDIPTVHKGQVWGRRKKKSVAEKIVQQ